MSLDVLYAAVSWLLLRWHDVCTFVLPDGSGLNWTLSIVFVVITARLVLFRFFLQQVHHQRRVRRMQPQLAELRTRYKNDRAELQRRTLLLQQEQGINPLAGCLPVLLQIPLFIGLLHVLRHVANSAALCLPAAHYRGGLLHRYGFDAHHTCSAAGAKLLGAPLAGRFLDSSHQLALLGGDATSLRLVVALLVGVSALATWTTQLLIRRDTAVPSDRTAATFQRLMLVGAPVGTLVSGVFFPLGVLLYWCTSNLWTAAQQLYVNRFHPGSG